MIASDRDIERFQAARPDPVAVAEKRRERHERAWRRHAAGMPSYRGSPLATLTRIN
jgi:hypothetical protein